MRLKVNQIRLIAFHMIDLLILDSAYVFWKEFLFECIFAHDGFFAQTVASHKTAKEGGETFRFETFQLSTLVGWRLRDISHLWEISAATHYLKS